MSINMFKTAALLALLGGIFVMLGRVFGGGPGMTFGLVLGLAFTGGSYWFCDKLAIRAARARPLEEGELPWLRDMVQDLSAKAGLPMPRLFITPDPQPNAFATGRNPRHAVVAVTSGILEVLDQEELRAVLAHELGHVRNRDMLVTSLAAAIGSAITWLANIAMFLPSNSDDDAPNPFAALIMMMLAPFAAMIVQMAVSRSREFGADETGADLLGDGEPLARALLKIDAYARQIPMNIDPSHATAYIINPLAGLNFQKLFSTHPPTEERVARLRSHRH